MQSIRRIMQQQGYNDGDPLSAEYQAFVLENVFEQHPDKETKMGVGIDYVMVSPLSLSFVPLAFNCTIDLIMVSRHNNFQDSSEG
ncbi:unnamed protein product [Lupinus luteus]|uniref:Uncharacterized protein n=1 Tax=Lupinus luteus TaxID=3873 RepID=A0AAV1YJ26_LUPLU